MSPEEEADLYVATINGPANGWGQYIVNKPGHPCHGAQSHFMLQHLELACGHHLIDKRIKDAFARAKERGKHG